MSERSDGVVGRIPYHLLVERVTDLTTQLRAIAPLAESIAQLTSGIDDARNARDLAERRARAAERDRDDAIARADEATRLAAEQREVLENGGDDIIRHRLKQAYRAGYSAGHSARAKPPNPSPEMNARGDLGRLMKGKVAS